MEVLVIIALVVILVIGARVIAGVIDGDRIRDYLQQRGCTLLKRQWTPFGPGWAGEQSSRLYAIEYRDAAGNRCVASCKTSMLAGVYLTNQRVLEPGLEPGPEVTPADSAGGSPGESAGKPPLRTAGDVVCDDPAAELARLRTENAELRARLDRTDP